MDKFEHFIYYTKTPEGPDYLSITVLGKHGLVERKVFPVVGEPLDQTPHIDGMKTRRLFIVRSKQFGVPLWVLTAMSIASFLLALAMHINRVV